MTPDLRLFLVTADRTHIDDFDSAVVYATSPTDAIAVAHAEIARGEASTAAGGWEPPAPGAVLSAVEVPAVRGPVLGHPKPC
jgi:hypothetical protein